MTEDIAPDDIPDEPPTSEPIDTSSGEDMTDGDSSLRGRLFDKRTWLKPLPEVEADTAVLGPRTQAEILSDLKRIDDRERIIGLVAGPLGAIAAVLLMYHSLAITPPIHHKGYVAPSITITYGLLGIFLGLVVVVAALSRRRSFLGFTLLFMGISLGIVFAIPFWIAGVWMLWHSLRYQRELSELTGEPVRGWMGNGGARGGTRVTATPTRSTSDRSTRSGSSNARNASTRKAKKSADVGPTPSKRYTPPKPTRIKPSD